ncbi:MAG: CZB domain-containing protein [Magnetococcales bacterium]|nr:CZB domain-containing protein [Magnetococcales bacterium]
MIDISRARLIHLRWLLQLESLLRKESIPQLQSYTACDLGVWFYSEGMEKYGKFPEMPFLEKRHKHFHETADQLVRCYHDRNYVEAEVALDELKRDSQDLIFMLTMLEYRMVEVRQPGSGPLKACSTSRTTF